MNAMRKKKLENYMYKKHECFWRGNRFLMSTRRRTRTKRMKKIANRGQLCHTPHRKRMVILEMRSAREMRCSHCAPLTLHTEQRISHICAVPTIESSTHKQIVNAHTHTHTHTHTQTSQNLLCNAQTTMRPLDSQRRDVAVLLAHRGVLVHLGKHVAHHLALVVDRNVRQLCGRKGG